MDARGSECAKRDCRTLPQDKATPCCSSLAYVLVELCRVVFIRLWAQYRGQRNTPTWRSLSRHRLDRLDRLEIGLVVPRMAFDVCEFSNWIRPSLHLALVCRQVGGMLDLIKPCLCVSTLGFLVQRRRMGRPATVVRRSPRKQERFVATTALQERGVSWISLQQAQCTHQERIVRNLCKFCAQFQGETALNSSHHSDVLHDDKPSIGVVRDKSDRLG